MLSNEDITFVISCFVVLFLCLSLLEASLNYCMQALRTQRPGNLFTRNTTFAVTARSFLPGLGYICMAVLFQGSHKDRETDLQKVFDTLQTPNGAELLCHVLANYQEQ